MQHSPRTILKDLVQKHGQGIWEDPSRCEGMLRDLCPACQREIFLLLAAVRQHIPEDLLAIRQGVSLPQQLRTLTRRLTENLGLSEEAAAWTIRSWGLALGILTSEQAVLQLQGERRASPGKKSPTEKASLPWPESLVVSLDGKGHYRSIQEAIDRATPPIRIHIRPGQYREALVLRTSLQLFADGDVQVTSMEAQPCMVIAGGAPLVHGISFERVVQDDTNGPAILFQKGQPLLEDCRIRSNGIGLALKGGRVNPSIQRSIIEGPGENGILVEKAGGRFEACRVQGFTRNVLIQGKGRARFVKSQFTGGKIGIDIREQGSAAFDQCEITQHAFAGITLREGGNPQFQQCTISHAEFGIEVSEKGRGIFHQCRIEGNRQGILIAERGNPTISKCSILHNQFGIRVSATGRGTIEECVISENQFAGISVKEKGNPMVRNCRIQQNGDVGIWIHKFGMASILDTDLRGNKNGSLHIEEGSKVKKERNLE
jgi:parallel beta-helix repeat protein